MLSPALLALFALPMNHAAPDLYPREASPLHASAFLLFGAPAPLTLHRIEDIFIGLSCLAIAAALATFLRTASRAVPYRVGFIFLAICTAIAGVCCLLAAAFLGTGHLGIISQASLVGAILAALTACLLPFLLPLLLKKGRQLEVTSRAARQSQTRFLAATESSSDAFMLLEAVRAHNGTIEDFIFTFLNANAEKILPANKAVGALLTRVLPLQPSDRLFQQFCQVIETGKPLIHEFALDADNPASPWMRHHVARLGEEGEFGLAITASDITERKRTEQTLMLGADIQPDSLTGLPNRSLLEDRILQTIARADRYRNRVALIFVNIDSFKHVNETYGRELGDTVLRITASRLRGAIRGTDSVIRLEGDEFVVLMPDMKLEVDVRRAAATLVAILREPILLGGKAIHISCSLGVTSYPDTALTVHGLLSAADEALCLAKRRGRDRYVLHTGVTEEDPEDTLQPPGDSDSDNTLEQRQYAD
ncbi:hypothetical protein BH10ACI4_BH10ACI4_07120 [soil metagenome]